MTAMQLLLTLKVETSFSGGRNLSAIGEGFAPRLLILRNDIPLFGDYSYSGYRANST